MTKNQDGKLRKKRVNKPNNFGWTKEFATLAYFCFRAGVNVETKNEIANILDVSLHALNTRINEFQIYNKIGKTEKVTKLTEEIALSYANRRIEECQRKIDLFLKDSTRIKRGGTLQDDRHSEQRVNNEFSNLVKESPLIKLIKTDEIINQFLSTGVANLNGEFLNQNNLTILEKESDLNFIETQMEGCYFIFSTLPKQNVPALSVDGYKCYDIKVVKNGLKFGCLYNGKGNGVKERLKQHLFNSLTLSKIRSKPKHAISGTGAMSLVSLTQEDFDKLEKEGRYNPAKHKLKSVRKSVQAESLDQREGHAFFLNGIDITEHPFSEHKFAVIVLKSDSEFGKILIEEAFCIKNGRPPLSRRYG